MTSEYLFLQAAAVRGKGGPVRLVSRLQCGSLRYGWSGV